MSQCQRVWFFPDTTIPLQESYYFWDNSNLSKYMSVEVLVHYKNGRLYHCLVNLEKRCAPHLHNRKENQNKVNNYLPDFRYYNSDVMGNGDSKIFWIGTPNIGKPHLNY